jgi:hypothetical protein
VCDSYVITPETLTKAKEKMVVMHPLPRINEIRYVAVYTTVNLEIELELVFIVFNLTLLHPLGAYVYRFLVYKQQNTMANTSLNIGD